MRCFEVVNLPSMIWLSKPFGRILHSMYKYSVLLVDDHPILLEGMKNLLQKPFEATHVATSGLMALELIKTTDFDLLITDYEMPGMTGLELVKAARKAQPDMKIIVLSMHDDPAVIKELLRSGVMGYILKKDTYKNLTDATTPWRHAKPRQFTHFG